MNTIKVRAAKKDDADKILKIYAPYVEKTAITFEHTIPSVTEFTDRIETILKKYPFLVAEKNGKIIGYSYASTFNKRAAYDWAVETTVYVHENYKKIGIGKMLYSSLEKILSKQNILNLYACIAYTPLEDPYLTNDSVKFHEHMGFQFVGQFQKCGYKFGRWYNMIWMEKHIGAHIKNPSKVKTFAEVINNITEKDVNKKYNLNTSY